MPVGSPSSVLRVQLGVQVARRVDEADMARGPRDVSQGPAGLEVAQFRQESQINSPSPVALQRERA